MKTSEQVDQLAPALVAAQQQIPSIKKRGKNPHFKSVYMRMEDILSAVLPVLGRNGLFLTQGSVPSGDTAVEVVSRLLHTSGQWIETSMRLPYAKLDPQGAGSAVTYGKRYSLAALLAIAAEEDDDGNAGTNRDPITSKAPAFLTLPGDPKKWGGYGGKLLSDVPVAALRSFIAYADKSPSFAGLCEPELKEAKRLYMASQVTKDFSVVPKALSEPDDDGLGF